MDQVLFWLDWYKFDAALLVLVSFVEEVGLSSQGRVSITAQKYQLKENKSEDWCRFCWNAQASIIRYETKHMLKAK